MKIAHKFFSKRAAWVKDKDYEQAEIKLDHEGTQALIYVGMDGFDIRTYELRGGKNEWGHVRGDTCGKNVRISMNSPLTLTFNEWDELVAYINKVRDEAHERV